MIDGHGICIGTLRHLRKKAEVAQEGGIGATGESHGSVRIRQGEVEVALDFDLQQQGLDI